MTADQRTIRDLRRHLRDLTATVTKCVADLDATMKGPSTVERGRTIAAITNRLELASDRARHFGLGEPLTPPRKPV
jgi:hypothetical protein